MKHTKYIVCKTLYICFAAAIVSKEEMIVLSVSEIIAELIKWPEHGKDVNLNR
jgi:hypothetical protein